MYFNSFNSICVLLLGFIVYLYWFIIDRLYLFVLVHYVEWTSNCPQYRYSLLCVTKVAFVKFNRIGCRDFFKDFFDVVTIEFICFLVLYHCLNGRWIMHITIVGSSCGEMASYKCINFKVNWKFSIAYVETAFIVKFVLNHLLKTLSKDFVGIFIMFF